MYTQSSPVLKLIYPGCPVYQGRQHAGVPGEHAQVYLQGDVVLLGRLAIIQALLQVSHVGIIFRIVIVKPLSFRTLYRDLDTIEGELVLIQKHMNSSQRSTPQTPSKCFV